MNYLTLLAAQATGKGSSWTMILMMVAVFAVMYFLMIRPQYEDHTLGYQPEQHG